ncbi:uncharacterized protein LY79DRAFT_667569 [Colletotrichum navitas]|uniref:Uncharacterized protein n=1 Tax=Colletotrichum navitas TaxID=681940 RepID=A0AAD8Q5K7_9PEZI|nr:uncharacterized protein LY79DRAFT_667569 [Colletotrichum navitas]KAK1596080.1 hypothetical protein LY79DRAFT_667569 [Colletotrichum navitas]
MALGNPVADTRGIVLPSRYEIRQISPAVADWVLALNWYTQICGSEVLSGVHSGELGKATLTAYRSLRESNRHKDMPPSNGLSYMLVDKEYVFKRPESEAAGGGLYWDEIDAEDPALADDQAAKRRLLEGIDFPIVSLSQWYDAGAEGDPAIWALRRRVAPVYCLTSDMLDERDTSTLEAEVTGPGQVLLDKGTSTLEGHEGKGLMKALAHFVMREMKARGFRGIMVTCLSPQVHHVFGSPPAPLRGHTLVEMTLWDYEKRDEKGQVYRPLAKSKVNKGWKVWTELADEASIAA